MTALTIVIVSYNTAEMTTDCLRRIQAAGGDFTKEIVVVDNASADGTSERIAREFPSIRLIANAENVGFGRANNQAIAEGMGRYVLLVNSDAAVPPDALRKTLDFMDGHPDCGISGARVVDQAGQLQPSARYRPTPFNSFLLRTGLGRLFPWVRPIDDMAWDHKTVRECDWVPGCYLMIRREVIEQVGLFDPRYFLYYEEVDLCLAAKRAGWKVLFDPDVEITHIGGESAKKLGEIKAVSRQLDDIHLESGYLFFRKNYGAACAFAAACLESLADLMSILKAALTVKRGYPYSTVLGHIGDIWRAYGATKGGASPAR